MSVKKVKMRRLENGIPVYFQPDHTSNVVSIVVKAGALKDPPNFLGRAHVFEHFAANSTRDFSTIETAKMLRTYSSEYWRGAGIYTTYANTAYGCGLLRKRNYILNLFPLFAQMVRYPNLSHHTTEEIIRVEQSAVICEWALHGEDNIEERASMKLLKMLYPNNPVSNRFDCDPNHLMGPSVAKELIKYHNEHYVSSNIGIIILGPDGRTAMSMARRAFGDMPEKQAPSLISLAGADIYPQLSGRLYEEFEYGDTQNKTFHLLFGFPLEPFGSAYADSIEVLVELLETHLQFAIRDLSPGQHLGTYHPRVWTDSTNLHGTMYVWMPVISMDGAKRAEEVLAEEIRKIHDGKFLDFGLNGVANKIKYMTSAERKAAIKILKGSHMASLYFF